MPTKITYIIGGAALAAGALYLLSKKSAPSPAQAAAQSAPNAVSPTSQRTLTPAVADPTAWTPPVGYPTLPAGWSLPAGAVPPAGWIPPITWQPPSWVQALGWQPGQPIPGIPAPAPPASSGTSVIQPTSAGPRGEAEPVQRAYQLGLNDGQPVAWSIPGVPSSLQNIPAIPGLTGVDSSSDARGMSDDDKFALWKTLFQNKMKWIDYCYDKAAGCLAAHGIIGDPYSRGDKGVSVAQDIAYLNDATPPKDETYENPGWYVLFSPSTQVFWMLPPDRALDAAKTDDWTVFLRPNEYHVLEAKGGPDFTVPDDLAPPPTAPIPSSTAVPGLALPDLYSLPGVGTVQSWGLPNS